MPNEEELQKYMMMIEQYKEQINQLDYQFQYIQAAIADYNRAKLTLESINKEGKDSEVLLPIGGSTYIDAKATDPSKVLFDIGSGIVTEKPTTDALKSIEKRIKDLERSQEKVSTMIQQLQAEASEVTTKAQSLYQQG